MELDCKSISDLIEKESEFFQELLNEYQFYIKIGNSPDGNWFDKLLKRRQNHINKLQFIFNNVLYNPHSEHNKSSGGITTSSGFLVSGDATNEQFFDDDGGGNLRRYYLVGTVRTYSDETAGTIDYSTGHITVNSLNITSISNVDDVASTTIRITSIPDSKDIVPVRNQILEIDMTNTTVTGEIDTIAVGSAGASSSYTTSTSYTPTKSF